MGVVKLSKSEITDYQKYSSMLAGNTAYSPSAYDLLETSLISSNTASLTFSNLNTYSQYTHLQLVFTLRASANTWVEFRMRINGDTGSNYANHRMRGSGSGVVGSEAGSSLDHIRIAQAPQTATSSAYYAGILDVLDFSNTNQKSTIRALSGYSADGYDDIRLSSGFWNNTAAVTSLTLFPASANIAAGSRFSLYGLKGS